MTPFNNKRRHRRFTVDVMEISGKAVFASEVVIKDVSITGVSLITEQKLEAGRQYPIRLMDDDLDVTIEGTVIWSENVPGGTEAGNEPPAYSAGLQFINLQPESLQSLVKFIEAHLVEKHKQVNLHEMSGLRCNIRFPVDRKETAVLNINETYRVKKISLGGLLMASSHYLEPETRLHMELAISANAHLSFTGRVVSCIASDDNASSFDIGIEFVGMPEPDRQKLKEFIRKLYLDDAGFSVA